MQILRQYVIPLLTVLVFLIALVAVSVRIFLPDDLAAPAPIEQVGITMENYNYISANLLL